MQNRPCTPCLKSDCAPKWCKDFCDFCDTQTVNIGNDNTVMLIIVAVIVLFLKLNKGNGK